MLTLLTRGPYSLPMTETLIENLGTCPGCGETMTEQDSRVFDSSRVSGRWHEDCGEDAKN